MMIIEITEDDIQEIINCLKAVDAEFSWDHSDLINLLKKKLKNEPSTSL